MQGISRKLRVPPPSDTTLRWAAGKWQYYCEHPEALPVNVARRRVYARDVWAAIQKEAQEKHAIADFAAFKSVLASLRQTRHRTRNEESQF